MQCQLCQHETTSYVLETFLCSHCLVVFKNPATLISKEEEKKRYDSHQNNEDDPRYVSFLNRLAEPLSTFLPPTFSGLDFGCGPGPTLGKILAEKGGSMKNYDPLFFPDQSLLIKEGYDVVTSSEVVEHFNNPSESWDLLVGLVAQGGLLGIMTQFYSEEINYASWWYKNDPTHVVFYQKETMRYIEERYNLECLYCDNKSIIIFKKR